MLPGARIETVKGGRAGLARRRQAAPGSPRALAEHIREITRIINKRGKSI
jgi:hypothetical protein